MPMSRVSADLFLWRQAPVIGRLLDGVVHIPIELEGRLWKTRYLRNQVQGMLQVLVGGCACTQLMRCAGSCELCRTTGSSPARWPPPGRLVPCRHAQVRMRVLMEPV